MSIVSFEANTEHVWNTHPREGADRLRGAGRCWQPFVSFIPATPSSRTQTAVCICLSPNEALSTLF